VARKITLAAFLIGLTSILLGFGVFLLTGKASLWGITSGESKIGGHLYSLLGLPVHLTAYYQQFKLVPVFTDPSQTIVVAILVGGSLPALLTGRFLIRHFPNKWMFVQAIAGGFFLGYGSRLALGCNIGNFFSAWTAAGINAVTFTASLLLGVFSGLKLTEKFFFTRAGPLKTSYLPPLKIQRVVGLLLLIASAAILLFLQPLPALFWVAGIAFGVLGTVSGICFGTCYRDIVARNLASGVMVRAIGIALLTFATGVYILQLFGIPFNFGGVIPQISQIQIALGGFIFGVGISLAGSCIFSSEWRAASGSIYSSIVLLSTIFLGMPALAVHYEWWLKTIPPILPSFSLYNIYPESAYLMPLTFSMFLIIYGFYVDSEARKHIQQILSTKIPTFIKLKP